MPPDPFGPGGALYGVVVQRHEYTGPRPSPEPCMRLAHRLARLEDQLGMPRDGATFSSGRRVTEEERTTAAERFSAALAADVAALVSAGSADERDGEQVDRDAQVLDAWSLQHGLSRDAERSRIVSEVLRGLTDEELDALDDALAPVERRRGGATSEATR